MRTIVQEYGPIYGEPVNGTVLGRPNGSVFVPSTNVISLTIPEDYRYMKYTGNKANLFLCDSAGYPNAAAIASATAIAQDLSSYIRIRFFEDAECTTHAAGRTFTAGQFNNVGNEYFITANDSFTGSVLYARAILFNNDTPIALSDVIEVEFLT